jgi:hypothetical protein
MSAWSTTSSPVAPARIPQAAPAANASEAVMGPGFTGATGGGKGKFSSIPSLNNPGGTAFWIGVGSAAFLVVLYHSLPK